MNEETVYKLTNDWNLYKEEFKEKKFYLFNIKDGDVIKLNEVSYVLLKNIDGRKSMKEIFEIMQNMYEVEEKLLQKDISMLVKKCLQKKILSI